MTPFEKIWKAIVFAILFLLPLGSLFYLNRGLNFHRHAVAELKQLGQVSNFQLTNQENKPVSPEDFRGKVTIVNFLPSDLAQAKTLTDRVAKVHRSFDDTDDVLFFSVIVPDTSITLLETATRLGIDDPKQWFLMGADSKEWQRLATEVYRLPNPLSDVVLVDTSLMIRNIYDIDANPEMDKIVLHTAKIIPKQKRR